MIKAVIHGPNGKMGRAMIASAAADKRFKLVGGLAPADRAYLGQDLGLLAGLGQSLGAEAAADFDRLPDCDLVLDCTNAQAAVELAALCAERGLALVTGTTGFGPEQRKQLERAGERIPLLMAANTSRVVYLLMELIGLAARQRPDADVDIIEMHGRTKPDAPSGTALELGRVLAAELGLDFNSAVDYGRPPGTARGEGRLEISSVRSGGIPSSHTVIFGFGGERLELTHHVYDYSPFAEGMIEAGAWLMGRGPGFYGLEDAFPASGKDDR